MLPIVYVSVWFSYAGTQASAVIRVTFCFEFMTNLSLDLSRRIKQCFWTMFSGNSSLTNAFRSGWQTCKTLETITFTVLSTIHWFLAVSQKRFLRLDVRFDGTKPELISQPNAPSTELRLANTRDGSGYVFVNVSVFWPHFCKIFRFTQNCGHLTGLSSVCWRAEPIVKKFINLGRSAKELVFL